MGREVRRVPATWEHPKNEKGEYIPLLRSSYEQRAREWDEGLELWKQGKRRQWIPEGDGPLVDAEPGYSRDVYGWARWDGGRPSPEDYMPDWPEAERTHLQMYETCTEGTPISPVMATPEGLARWLTDNGADAFAGQTASYEAWLRVCRGGFAPSAVISGGVMRSGVEAGLDAEREKGGAS